MAPLSVRVDFRYPKCGFVSVMWKDNPRVSEGKWPFLFPFLPKAPYMRIKILGFSASTLRAKKLLPPNIPTLFPRHHFCSAWMI